MCNTDFPFEREELVRLREYFTQQREECIETRRTNRRTRGGYNESNISRADSRQTDSIISYLSRFELGRWLYNRLSYGLLDQKAFELQFLRGDIDKAITLLDRLISELNDD